GSLASSAVPCGLRARRRPPPPIWQGVTSPEGAASAAARGVNIVGTAPNARMKEVVERDFETWSKTPGDTPPLVGIQRHVFVVETEAEATAGARGAYQTRDATVTSPPR